MYIACDFRTQITTIYFYFQFCTTVLVEGIIINSHTYILGSMQQQFVVCNLPRTLGGLSVPELKGLLHREGVGRDKSNNYLKTKRDMCMALTLRASENFIEALTQNIDRYNPSIRDLVKKASEDNRINEASLDRIRNDKQRVKDMYHDLLMENYHFDKHEDDAQVIGLRNQYESGKTEIQDLQYRLHQKETEIRMMQDELNSHKKHLNRYEKSADDSEIAAVKVDVMHLKMQERYLLNAIDELRLHLNRLGMENSNNSNVQDVQSKMLQLLDMKRKLEDSAQKNADSLDLNSNRLNQAEMRKLDEATQVAARSDERTSALADDADKIHREVEEKQQDIEQLRINLTAVRTRLQQYVDVFPRIEDAIAFATSSSDLQEQAKKLKEIIRVADGVSRKINAKMENLFDIKTQHDPEDVVSVLNNVDNVLDRFDALSQEVATVSGTLEKAQSDLQYLHETFVSLAGRVDKNVDAANLGDHELASILKNFIVNRTYLQTAISDLHQEHSLAQARTSSVKSKLANISSSLEKLESTPNVVGGNKEQEVDSEDLLNVLTNIENRIQNVIERQARERQTYVEAVNHYKDLLNKRETEIRAHVEASLNVRIEVIRSELHNIEDEIARNNTSLQSFVQELQHSKLDDKKKFAALSKTAFDLMERQSKLLDGLKVKINAINFAETIKNFAGIEDESLKHDDGIFEEVRATNDEGLRSIAALKVELKEALLEHSRLSKDLSAVDFELKKAEVRSGHERDLEDLLQKKKAIELEIQENEEELRRYENELQLHAQSATRQSTLISEDVYSALENAYQTQLASKQQKLERVNEELDVISNDNSEDALMSHQRQLHHDASSKLQDIIQRLKEEILSIQTDNGELEQLRAHKVKLLEKEKELTQKYLGTLEGRDSDLVSLAERSKQLHQQHNESLHADLTAEEAQAAQMSMIELGEKTKKEFEMLQNVCREKLSMLDQERTDLIQAVRALNEKANMIERERQTEIHDLEQRLQDIQSRLSSKESQYENLHSVARDILQQFQITKKELEDLKIKTDPDRVKAMEERLHFVEMQNNRNMMLKEENEHFRIQLTSLRLAQKNLQQQVLNSRDLTQEIGMLQAKLEAQTSDFARERVNFERKSAEKAYLDGQMDEIRATINNFVGQNLFKFEQPRSIAKEPVEAVRDIAEDYDFFRSAYQDTAQRLRDNIVDLVKTLNKGNTTIDYESIQKRVDALKYLSEDQQLEKLQQTRKLIAEDYETLVKTSKEEARLLARSYDAETDWQQVEAKMNRLLAPEGSIEHSRDSLKLINDFFRLTKSSTRKLQEEQQDGEIERLRLNMIAYHELAVYLSDAKSNDQSLVSKAKQLFEVSKEISFEKLGTSIYTIDEKISSILKSFLTVFKLRNDELFLELVRNIRRMQTTDKQRTSFYTIDEFMKDAGNAKTPDNWKKWQQSNASRIELIKQLFPKIELVLLHHSRNSLENVYFDPIRLGINAINASSTGRQPAQQKQLSKTEITRALYFWFYKKIGGDEAPDLPDPGNAVYDDKLFDSMLALLKFYTVQNHMWNSCVKSGDGCFDIINKEIRRVYQRYEKPEEEAIPNEFQFKDDNTPDALANYFKRLAQFVQQLEDRKKGGRMMKQFEEFLADAEDIRHHHGIKQSLLQTALANNETRLSQIKTRGGRVIDVNQIRPYDIRKLNAVLAKINDMVAANLKDLESAKAVGFENTQYEIKLRKLESDLLEKENALSQFSGITKQSVERALLLEQELLKHNKTFFEFCLFLMGRRKDPRTNATFFDSRKNVFAFRQNGKSALSELDWHARLNLPREDLIFRSFTDIEHIKGELKRHSDKLNFRSLEETMASLVECYDHFQGSNQFYEEDLILQEITKLRTALDKIKIDDNDSQMTLAARFEDLKDLNETWKLDLSCKAKIDSIDARNVRNMLNSIGSPNLPERFSKTYISILFDTLKHQGENMKDELQAAEAALNAKDDDEFMQILAALKADANVSPIVVLIIDLIEWSKFLSANDLFVQNNQDFSLAKFRDHSSKLENIRLDSFQAIEALKGMQDTQKTPLQEKLAGLLLVVNRGLAILQSLTPSRYNTSASNQEAQWLLEMKSPLGKAALQELFDGKLLSEFSSRLRDLVQETLEVTKIIPAVRGGGISKDSMKQFFSQTDNALKQLANLMWPAQATRTQESAPRKDNAYETFVEKVLSTTNKEDIAILLDKIVSVIKNVRFSAGQEDNESSFLALATMTKRLLQERLECHERADDLRSTLEERASKAEEAFREQVEKCNEQIHSANQAVVKMEDKQSNSWPSSGKGTGTAYGYIIESPSITTEASRSRTVNGNQQPLRADLQTPDPPPTTQLILPQTIDHSKGSLKDVSPSDNHPLAAIEDSLRESVASSSRPDLYEVEASDSSLAPETYLGEVEDIGKESLKDVSQRSDNSPLAAIKDSPRESAASSSDFTYPFEAKASDSSPAPETNLQNVKDVAQTSSEVLPPAYSLLKDNAIVSPDKRQNNLNNNEIKALNATTSDPMRERQSEAGDNSGEQVEDAPAKVSQKVVLPAPIDFDPNVVLPSTFNALPKAADEAPPLTSRSLPDNESFSSPWEVFGSTDNFEKSPTIDLPSKPRKRLIPASDVVFHTPGVKELQEANTNMLESPTQSSSSENIVHGGDRSMTFEKCMGSILMLYINYSRFIRNPRILRIISTIDKTGGNFVNAMQTCGIDESEAFYVTLLRLIFVDVTDLVFPDDTTNNTMRKKLEKLQKAHTQTYRMQLSGLGKQSDSRFVVRTDLYFRFCLDFLSSLEISSSRGSLDRIKSSLSEAALTNFTNMDLFWIQVLYQCDVKRKYLPLSRDFVKKESLKNINTSHTLAATSAVLTYVKIRCDKDGGEIWNERYRLGVQRNQAVKKELLVEFNTHPFPYYNHSTTDLRLVSEKARKSLPKSNNTWAIAANVPYQYHMLFGPFTKVFSHDTTIQQIANECDGIKFSLLSGDSVLLLGYGASGAGKTSTLICQSGEGGCQTPGILPYILADEDITSRYQSLELSICELLAGNNDATGSVSGKTYWKTDKMRFNYEKATQSFRFSHSMEGNNDYTPLPEHAQRMDSKKWNFVPDDKTSLDTIIQHCIEVDRRSRGTSNNPNSSRSHVLVFIHFQDGPYLIVGDFAGVENEFECRDIGTLLSIYNSQKCNDEGSCIPVYNSNIQNADQQLYKSGQCGAGQPKAFVLYGEDPTIPKLDLQVDMILKLLASMTDRSKILDVNVQKEFGNDKSKLNRIDVERLLKALRDKSQWDTEKMDIKGLLFQKSEAATYMALADDSEIHELVQIMEAKSIARLRFTISMLAASSVMSDPKMWPEKVLEAIDSFLNFKKTRTSNYKSNEHARREIKGLFDQYKKEKKGNVMLKIFGFDGPAFEQAVRLGNFTVLEEQMKQTAKQFTSLFNALKQKPNQIKQFLWAVFLVHIDAFNCSFQKIKQMLMICKCRTFEGRYINSSLEAVRITVKEIIRKQQEEVGRLRTTPAFADSCLDMYCNPFKEDCMESGSVMNDKIPSKSLLIDTIVSVIGEARLHKMKIAVFTVFLMNRTVNNDPPVPYIFAEDFRSEVVRLRNFDENKKLAEEIEKYLTGPEKDAMLQEIDRHHSIASCEIDQKVIEDLINQISAQRSRLGDNIANVMESQIHNMSAQHSLASVEKLLRTIDGLNAVHPIGTLQVTDAIAKYNQSDVTCSFSSLSSPYVAQLREKLEVGNGFLNIMNKSHLTLLPPADPTHIPKISGGACFDPRTVDEFLHQWLLTTDSTYSEYLYKINDRINKIGGKKRELRRSKRSNQKPLSRRSRRRSAIKLPVRTTRKRI